MRRILLLLISLAAAQLSGCAGSGLITENSNKVNYYYDGARDPWLIEGQFLQTAASIKVFVNKELSIDGTLSLIDLDGEVFGAYRGVPMKVTCSFTMSNGRQLCDVYVKEQFAASLLFDGCGLLTCY